MRVPASWTGCIMVLRKHAAAQRHTRNLRRVVDVGQSAQARYCQYLWRCNRCEDLRVTFRSFISSHARHARTNRHTSCETLPLIMASTAYFSARMTYLAAQHSAKQVGLLGFAAIVV